MRQNHSRMHGRETETDLASPCISTVVLETVTPSYLQMYKHSYKHGYKSLNEQKQVSHKALHFQIKKKKKDGNLSLSNPA